MESLKKSVYASMQKLSLGIVWRELQVFSKLLYKGWNQHRRDKSFQMLLRVSKDLHKYQALSLSNYVKRAWKNLPESGSMSTRVVECINGLSSKLTECASITAQLLSFIETTFIAVNTRLCMSLFIPFNLLMVSTLSRLWYCLRFHLQAISETTSMLNHYIPASQLRRKTAESVLSCLAPKYRHYLQDSLPASPEKSLGTAVLRMDNVHSSTEEVPEQVPEHRLEQLSPPSKEAFTEDTPAAPLFTAPVTVKTRAKQRRRANTIVLSVRAGRRSILLRIRCPRYLKGMRVHTCFKVMLSTSKLLKSPWNWPHSAKFCNWVKIKPLNRVLPYGKKKCVSGAVVAEREMESDDIDDIFSAINV